MKQIASVVAMLISATTFAQIPSPEIPAGQGVNIHFTAAKPGEMEMLARGGFGFVRMDLHWASTEKQKGVYDFSAYDRLINDLTKHNIRCLFILDYNHPLYDNNLSPHTPEGRAAFARWAAAAVTHFAGKGILWEMWNEPNLAQFWKPKPNVDDYAKLAIEVGKAIREVAPNETYIGPAMSTIDLPYLESCFKAGVLAYFSAVSVHPYRQSPPETVVNEYRKLRLLIDRYAPQDKQIPILSGEWGYADVANKLGQENQGKYLARQWLVNLSCDVPLSIWYDWHDDGTNPTDNEHHFGTVGFAYREGQTDVYEPKPAYGAVQTLTSNLKGYRFNKRLALDNPDDWCLLFTKGDEVKVVAWTVSPTPRQVVLPVANGRFTAVSHLGKHLAPAAGDAKGLSIQLTDGPVYLTPDGPIEHLQLLANWTRLKTDRALTAPLSFTPDLKVTNTTNRPLRLFTWGDNAVEVAAGASHSTGNTYSLLRTAHPTHIRQQLHLDGFPIAYQESVATVANPITVTISPLMGGKLPVRIETPEPLTGKLELTSPVTATVDFSAQLGETVVQIPATTEHPRYTVTAKLVGTDGKPLTEIPSRTYQILPSDAQQYTLVPDGDMKIASEQSIKEVPALAADGLPANAPALQLDYRFDAGWKFLRLAPPAAMPIDGKPIALGLWIRGDGSGNSPRMRFADSTGQVFQPTAPELHYKGWRYVEFPLDSGQVGHWGGANDGIIHYPIRLDTLFLLDSPNRKGTAGSIQITAPVLIFPAGK